MILTHCSRNEKNNQSFVVPMQEKWKHKVKGLRQSTRIVDYCGKAFEMLGSKSATKKAIDDGRITLNGQRAYDGDFLAEGDIIILTGSGVKKAKSFAIEMDIVYEDDFVLIVNKPAGIAVNGNRYKTVENAVVGIAKKSERRDALPRPIAVHRLDVPTKGLVLLAKTKSALIKLGRLFQEGKVQKEYMAIVHGKPTAKGIINKKVEGKDSESHFETIRTVDSRVFEHLSLVKFKPITGRTHQLRIHSKHIGHLIVGDRLYADGQKTILGKGLFLCASKIAFNHPDTFKMKEVSIPMPNRFKKLLDREERRF